MTEDHVAQLIHKVGRTIFKHNPDQILNGNFLALNSGVAPEELGIRTTLTIATNHTDWTRIVHSQQEVKANGTAPDDLYSAEIQTEFDSRYQHYNLMLRAGNRHLVLKIDPDGNIKSFEGGYAELETGGKTILLDSRLKIHIPTLQGAVKDVERGYAAIRSEILPR